jgi:3-phenylpropionate/trans-cinnamate dioxygenase ferredoxin subunit
VSAVLKKYAVARVGDIAPGDRLVVTLDDGRSIGVFNVGGTFYALRNICPHQGAPLCEAGVVTGTARPVRTASGALRTEWIREGEILRCPWHKWEFELATGETIFDSRWRVRTYEVSVEDGLSAEYEPIPPAAETFEVTVEDDVVVVRA